MQLQDRTDILIPIVAGTLLFFLLCVFIVAFAALFRRKRQQFKIEQQNLQAKFAETLLRSQLEIKEQTLQHIGYELHDNLGQMASLIKINLTTLQLEDPVHAATKIEDTKDLVRQLILDLKSLSVDLNGNRIAQLGLIRAIESEVEKLNKTGRFRVVLEGNGLTPLLSANTTIILFRMLQEIINNAVKHSEATRISIRFHVTEHLFTLVITDDGVGFNLKEKIASGGSGLINLKNRAKLINANLLIESSPNAGTSISIELSM